MTTPMQIADHLIVKRYYECEDCEQKVDEPEGDNGDVTVKMSKAGWEIRRDPDGAGGLICPLCVLLLNE